MHTLETQAVRPPAVAKGGISHEENVGIRAQCGTRRRRSIVRFLLTAISLVRTCAPVRCRWSGYWVYLGGCLSCVSGGLRQFRYLETHVE